MRMLTQLNILIDPVSRPDPIRKYPLIWYPKLLNNVLFDIQNQFKFCLIPKTSQHCIWFHSIQTNHCFCRLMKFTERFKLSHWRNVLIIP